MPKQSVPETCRKCGAYCCNLGSVTVTAEERNRILDAGHPNRFVKVGLDRYDIKSGPDGRCAYLKDDNSCGVYEERPAFCRIWPVNVELKDGKLAFSVFKCPLYPELSEKDIEGMKKGASRIPVDMIKGIWDVPSIFRKKLERFETESL